MNFDTPGHGVPHLLAKRASCANENRVTKHAPTCMDHTDPLLGATKDTLDCYTENP